MKTKSTYVYVRLLHLLSLIFLLTITGNVFSQSAYEGFGANAVGGSNSTTVYHVTNLNSSGAGSLANGIGSNKTIVFDVSGTIYSTRLDLVNITYLTIDGSTAPYPGIILDNRTASGGTGPGGDVVSFDGSGTHHCILKGIRTINAGNDGINVLDGSHDIMITNCSSYNCADGEIDIAGGDRVTIQWCILGASSTGGPGCMLITGTNVTVHHNLMSPARAGTPGERCPLVHCNYSPVGNPNADIRNNVIWKFGRDNGTGSGYGSAIAYNATGNIINNYYYTTGPSAGSATNTDDGYGAGATGKAYIAGNVSGNTGANANSSNNHAIYAVPAVATQDACTAAQLVLANAGPRPLNPTDQALINAVTLPNCSASSNQPPTANAGNNITHDAAHQLSNIKRKRNRCRWNDSQLCMDKSKWTTTFTLGTAGAATTTLTNLIAGTYVFRLTVTDDDGATGTDDVTVTVSAAVNQPPTANAGSDITLTLPVNSTTLLGSGTDADGTIASYAWARVSGPTTFTLGTANAATTTLSNLVQGTYVFRLTVTDNGGATGTDNVTVTVITAPNIPPTANAGSDVTLTLPVNSTTLLGSGTDADGTIASYAWARVSGPTTFTLGTANAATTTLSNLVQGTYVFRLTVTDNSGATATDNVTVTVNAATNQPPTANAGSDVTLTLPVNSTTLLGSGSDADGTIASYAWARVSGPTTFTLGTANAATTTLSNLVQGTYVFRLTVTDNSGATATDNVTVTVIAAANQPPTANAGSDITLTLPVNSTTLNGSGSDPDGTIASYAWARVSGPTTFTLGTANAATSTLTNLVQGTYVFSLTVTDNSGATATDNVTVTVNAATNQPPAANAGNNITLTLPTNSTTLVGSGTDADGTITGYAWTRISGPATYTFGTANAATTTLSNLVQGTYVFRLTVTDNAGATGTDDVTVTVNAAANQPPTANAGSNIVITLPTNSTTLTGSGTDADGTITGYAWTRISGPATYTLANANAATTALNNLVQGVYIFRLTVTDNSGATATDDVMVTVNASAPSNQAPIAIAGNNITLNLPANSTTLNGTASFDPDGTIVSYAWTRVSGPATYTIANANAATTGLSNLVAGTYIFQLTVTDNSGATDDDNITVIVSSVANQPPAANAGNNIVLTLPLNSTNLNGGGSTDADGTIVSYAWTRVSGPATYTLANANSAATGLNNLVQGTYVFRLTVTDNDGATSTDDVTVTVNAAPNQAPTANAGTDMTLTLPLNSTILTGSGLRPRWYNSQLCMDPCKWPDGIHLSKCQCIFNRIKWPGTGNICVQADRNG